jgi:hypothetical protein
VQYLLAVTEDLFALTEDHVQMTLSLLEVELPQ